MCFLTAPTAPRSLMIVDVTDTTVTLSWMPPVSPNGIITRYQVQFRPNDNSDDFNQQSTCSALTTVTVMGLMSNTEYVFEVRATTRVGNGPFSNNVTVHTGKLQSLLCSGLYLI